MTRLNGGMIFIIMMMTSSCVPGFQENPEPPDFVTKHGVKFYLQGSSWTQLQVEIVEDNWFPRLAAADSRFEGAEKSVKGLEVYLFKEMLECEWTKYKYCSGYQDGRKLMVVDFGFNNCPLNSSYRHEMLHWIEMDMLGLYNPDHVGDYWETVRKYGVCE